MTSSSMTMPALVPLGSHTGKPPIPLRRPVLLVGSRNIAHLHLLSRKVSKAHALIINSDGRIYIRDLASRTRVYINGEQVRQANLKNGDLIKIGSFTFRLTIPSAWQTRPRDTHPQPGQLNVDGVEIPVRLDERVTLIGRRPTCDVSLLEDSASTAHAVIFEMGGRRFIRDLGSRTGTFVNGRKIHQEEIDFGDVIRIGETDFHYSPASEIPTGPIPADELDADFDELEDLVGTAPLMEEPPEVTAKRLEGEERPAVPPAPPQPPSPEASHAAIPLDFDEDEEHAPLPEADIIEPRQEVPSLPAKPESDDLPAEEDAFDSPVSAEAPADDALDLDLEPADDELPVEAIDDIPDHDIDTAADDQTADQPEDEPAGIEDLDLLHAETPSTEAELDLATDHDLEAEPVANDPEATHALPPDRKPRPKTPPVISDEIIDQPIVPPVDDAEIESDAADDIDLAPVAQADDAAIPLDDADVSESADEPVEDPAGDTVALAATQATLDETDDETEAESRQDAEPDTDDVVEDETEAATSAIDLAPVSDAPSADEQTVESTAPTPESAQSLEPELETASADLPDPDGLTDTGFDREIHAFAADSADPVDVDQAEDDSQDDEAADLLPTAVEDDTADEADEDEAAELDLAPVVEQQAPAATDEESKAIPVDDLDTEVDEQLAHDLQSADDAGDLEPVAADEDEAPFEALDLDVEPSTTPAAAHPDPAEAQPAIDESDADDIAPDFDDLDDLDDLGDPDDRDDDSLPIAGDGQAPAAEVESKIGAELETDPADKAPSAESPTPKPSQKDQESFTHGVNQWGFLGGSPLVLGDIPQPPPPARGGRATPRAPRGMPFGKQPLPVDDLAPVDSDSDEYADPFTTQTGPLPQIDEVDVFSQLGAPPDDDPFFGAAALGHAKASGTDEPQIPPTDSADADEPVSPEPAAESDPSHDDDTDPQWADDTEDPFDDLEIEDAPAATADEPDDADETPVDPDPTETRHDATRNGAKRPTVLFEEQASRQRKRRWFFSVPFLFVMMLATASAAAAAIWYTVPVTGVVIGSLSFQNLKDKSSAQRNLFFDQQAALLADQTNGELTSTRERAKARLRERYGNVSPGFLDDAQAYALLVDRSRRAWVDADGGTIQLQLQSPHPDLDSQRLHALLLALFEGNRRLIDQHNNARHNADEVAANLRLVQDEVTRLQVRLEEVKRDGERPATVTDIATLKREIATLEKEWRVAEDAAHHAQAEIERMREGATRAAIAAQPGQDTKVALEDMELRQMQDQLERLDQRLQVNTVADNLEIDRTRQQMDAAISRLEQQIEQVKNQMADVPEMKGYVTVARILQDTTHQLTNELIHSQKQQLDTINAHKRKLDEQLAARQNEVWENDPDLKNLTALLDIQRRHYNAAIAADHPPAKEAMDDLAAAITRLEGQIDDRRRVLGNDMIYADAIRGMEELIRTSEKRLEEDQKRAEERIAMLQQQLAEAAPDLQKLPDEQKTLAAELEKRLVEMNAARKAYSDAMARVAKDGDTIRETEAQALALRRRIESRRQELLTERLQALSEQQQAEIRERIQARTDELTALQAAAHEAYRVYLDRFGHLAAAERGVVSAVESASKRDEIARELAAAQARRDELAARKKEMDQALASAIFPIEPTRSDIQMSHIRDERPLYALISVGGIALLFGCLMLAAHHAQTRDTGTQRVIQVEPPLFPSHETIDEAVNAPTPPERLQEPTTA